MPFDTLERFPCGDFKPGYAPSPGNGVGNSYPSIYVPEPPESDAPFNIPDSRIPPRGPDIPVPGTPSTGGPGGPRPAGPATAKPGPSAPTPTGPATPTPGPTGGTGGGGGGGGGPVTPRGPGDVTGGGGRRGPITPRGTPNDIRFRCASQDQFCPPTNYETQSLIVSSTQRRCVRCDQGAGESVGTWYARCPFQTENACLTLCRSSTVTPTPCVTTAITGGSVVTPRTETNESPSDLKSSLLRNTSVTNSTLDSMMLRNSTPKKSTTSIVLNNKNFKGNSSTSSAYNESSMYHPYYNFFKTQADPNTKLVSNNLYLNIFSDLIASEVSYFLININSESPWHEIKINNLTTEKIAISIKPELLTALSNIHTVANKKVNEQNFLQAIRKHLLEGTIDEFDPNYYFYTYNSQLEDKVIEYSETGETRTAIDAAFSIFEVNSNNANYDVLDESTEKNEYKRMRFLLEDLESGIRVLQLEGNQDNLSLNNVGAPVRMIDESGFVPQTIDTEVRIGDGAGYYFSTLLIDGSEYPLPSEHSLSDVGYLNPNSKYTTLNILGKEGELRLSVTSPQTIHEFYPDYNFSADVGIMYFALDLKSVGDIPNPNSVINILSGTYKRLTDEEAAHHSRNYSFNIIKVNVDYRDPFIHYSRDVSNIHLEQDDFDLREFDVNRSIRTFRIMPRTIPAAIILTPGCGSYHNPFNSRSTVQQLIGSAPVNVTGSPEISKVIRILNIRPSQDSRDDYIDKPFLDSSNIYETLGLDHFGLYEKYFLPNIHGNIFTYNPSSNVFSKSYYYNNTYNNIQPPSSMRSPSPESNLINIIHKLTSVEGVKELTWWDVFRRLTLNQIGSLNYTNSSYLTRELSLGYVKQIPIKNVLSRWDVISTGIPEGATVDHDKIYINESDRILNAT